MSYTWDEIQSIMASRRSSDAPTIRRMVDIAAHYNGDLTVPLVDVSGQPEMNALMPFLVAEGIDGIAMRAAGPAPTVHTPALNPLKETGIRSIEYAAIRRRACYASWHWSRLPLILGRAYRQLCGYGTFGMVVVPDFEARRAKIEFRDALSSYPALRAPEDVRDPENIGFVYGKSPEWVVSRYPEAAAHIGDWQQKHPEETLWDLVEWIDGDDVVIGLLGPRSLYATQTESPTPTGQLLRRWENRAGFVPAVVPRRVTLDRLAGQMDKIVPLEEWSAKLMALDFIAAERSVFPDMVVIGEEGRTPTIIGGGGWQDGRTGNPNLLQSVRAVQQLQSAPGPMTTQTLDRLERNARISSGTTPFYSGETTGSLRTGRAIDALGGYSIDPRIAELQTIMQFALETVNRSIFAVERGYWPEKKYTVFSGWPSDRGHVEYIPGTHFESDENAVSYSFPGSDVSSITVAVSQLQGAKLMSRHTARDKHPFIEDAEMEDQLTVQEAVDDAMLVAWQQSVADGSVSWVDLAEFYKLLKAGMPWSEAILQVQLAAQERQAEQAAQMAAQQAQGPDMTMGPAAQPGLGGGPMPVASVPPPQQGLLNVASMTRALAAGAKGA